MEPETKIGGYRVVSLLGAGGMGEVYRAHDPKLDREVAIKILPEEMSADPERIARFQREARALATLQHPNIASVYGFEEDDNSRFLVMELVEGQDLSERLGNGPIPVDEAVALATQLTEGLAAAHEQGIIHRDLKPANIKITAEGDLKILDFGLARAYTGDPNSEEDVLNSPTITAAMTQAGVILGTAAYMSPEQARGEAVDQRADLWAFGVILFEMLTGQRYFAGDTVSDTLAAVLRAELDWGTLPKDTPANVRRVLRRCLARNLKERLRSAADAGLELAEVEQPADTATPVVKRSPALPLAIGLLAIAVLAAAWIFKPTARGDGERLPTHLALALPDGLQVASRDMLPLGAPQPCLAISDDGRLIVAVVERDGATWLYRRFFDQPGGDVLEESRDGYHPQISPDGNWISFMRGNALMRIGARGNRATQLIELPNSFGHTWISNDEIVINRSEASELVRVDAGRGTATPFERKTALDEYFWPSRIPGTETILINSDSHVAKSEEADMDGVSLMDLATNEQTVLGIGGSMPRLLGDHLLLVRDGLLMAAPFNPDRLTEPVRPATVLDGLLVEGWIGQYAVSNNSTLIYVPGEWLLGNELVWDDGKGVVERLGFPLIGYGDFELSPDGRSLGITVGGGADTQVWIYDLERGARQLHTTDRNGSNPTWSPDGERLAYGASTGDPWGVYVRTVGSDEPATWLFEADVPVRPYAWHDEAGMLMNVGHDIYLLDPDDPGEPELVVSSDASEWGPDISPDGRWFAYTSDESGRYEIYARAFGGDRSYSVSLDGGEEPIFSEDGKTIFYRYGNRFYATPILEASADGKRFRAGRPDVVVEGAYSNVPGLSYDVGPDGRLLLLRTDGGTERPGHLNVILNWDVTAEK